MKTKRKKKFLSEDESKANYKKYEKCKSDPESDCSDADGDIDHYEQKNSNRKRNTFRLKHLYQIRKVKTIHDKTLWLHEK